MFADVDAVVARAMGAWRPPPRLSLSSWADANFVISAETAAEPGRWRTLPYQREIMDAITDPRVSMVAVMKSARVGYALALDTPLPTPLGWTTMGDVAVGDALFDEAGRPCRVLTKSQVFTDHDCYRVQFCDGSEIIADASHRWLVESDVALEHLTEGKRGRTGRPKPGETKTYRGVIDTATMARAARTSRGRRALAVVVARPLRLRRRALPIPPYTLGLWLGDGHSDTARITQHRSDVETARYVAEDGIRTSVRYTDKRYPNNASILLDVPDTGKPVSPWTTLLRELGLRNNKHIPVAYLRASHGQRLALLRGLMDSDGTAGKDGRAEFVNTKEHLAHGVYELVVSLGMKATLRHRPPQRPGCLDQWRVNFKPTPDVNPFRILRKAARVRAAERPSITKRRRVVAVERIPSVPTQCIEVDSGSHLFLAGKQMVPTHNTLMMSCAIGYYMAQDPSSILVVQPTVDDAKGFSKETIAPMLRDVPVLSKLVFRDIEEKGKGPKDSSATLQHKAFAGGILSMIGANSGAGFRRVSRRVVLFDEVDAYPPSAGAEGDQIRLGMKRSEAFHNRKTIAGSTPLVAGASRIEDLFLAGDQRRYHMPCPHCGHRDFLVFDRESVRGHVMKWDDDSKPEDAYFKCRGKGCKIEHKDKRWMVERGEWIAENPAGAHRSYHLWSAISYSPNTTWGHIAAEFLAANKDPLKLRTFVNTMLGETWQERGEAPEWERLHARREQYAISSVPEGVLVITAGVDVQQDRFVYEVVGWGEGKESWSIDAGIIEGDTAQEATWLKLDGLLDRVFTGHDGAIHTITRLAVDSGYRTQMVYGWGHRHRSSGRVMATKGVGGVRPLIDAASKVEITINGRKFGKGYKIWPIGVDTAKAELYGFLGLSIGEDGAVPPGYCHFPEHPPEFFKQLTAEHLVENRNKKGQRVREWHVLPGRENHHLDTRVLARAAVFSLRTPVEQPRNGTRPIVPRRARAAVPATPATSSPPVGGPGAAEPPPPPRPSPGFLGRPSGGRPGGWLGGKRR